MNEKMHNQSTHWMPLPPAPKGECAMTNADRIRAMSDEKLAEFLLSEVVNNKCYGICCGSCTGNDCISGIVKWLQQPAEGEAYE